MIFFSGGSCCAISFHSFTFPWIFDDRWVSKMYLVSVRSASVSLGQKPHSLFAVHECGHVIANLSPCLCKIKMRGSSKTYKVLHDALCHPLVNRRDLGEGVLAISNLLQFIPGNISLILKFNNNTITYKYSA